MNITFVLNTNQRQLMAVRSASVSIKLELLVGMERQIVSMCCLPESKLVHIYIWLTIEAQLVQHGMKVF